MNNDLGVKSKAGSKLKSKGKKLKGSDSDSPALPNSVSPFPPLLSFPIAEMRLL
jgi:hypothetical protein